ncbi:peptidyl-prolyl cis-trans isomerase [Croceicoccus pelagius]|uniref:Parvulin-like PPIase n=1 Tax=Croceicoccus pelagius TaxID=1703341 RepID=A0A917DLM2_9SPHN|nr:SurA N-terminal domain-containing protein [Croceicoccus pelagius]GGD46345.1 peptidylprolyl isomerase [Croceicoccus pelagius]
MIQGFRKLFQSPIGLAVTLGFVGLIALAFASADITGSGFGGIAGGERVATVGDERISTSTYRETLNGAFERARGENPGLTWKEFLDGGATDGVLDQMTERLAVFAFAKEHGIRIGDSLVGSELAQIPAFQGPDGQFSQEMYQAALQQRGLSEKLVREDLEQGLAARMMLIPAQIGTQFPEKMARQYARLLNETRHGSVAFVPSSIFASDIKVTDDQLKSYLATNRSRYSLPERRTVRYAIIDRSGVADIAATDADVAAYYESNKDEFAGSEKRVMTQLVMPTEAAANAVLSELANPSRMAAVAREKGLSTTQVSVESRSDLSAKTSPAVTQAVYDAAEGKIAGPVRGPLGWYLMRVDSITRTEDRSIAEVRGEIAAIVTEEKRRTALAERASEAENQLNSGASLQEVAKSLDAEVKTTGALLENGQPFDQASADVPAQVLRVVQNVFAMDSGSDAQIAIAADGESYILYEPGKITASAPPPFDQIKPALEAAYKQEQGSKKASAAADKVLAAIRKGQTPAEAMKLIGKTTPPVSPVDMSRQELVGAQQQVPPPLALMFSMAKGSTKKLEAPQKAGWFIVDLDRIETKDIGDNDPLVAATVRQLGPAMGGEMGEQLTRAIQADVGVTKNQTAIDAVVAQLTGNR